MRRRRVQASLQVSPICPECCGTKFDLEINFVAPPQLLSPTTSAQSPLADSSPVREHFMSRFARRAGSLESGNEARWAAWGQFKRTVEDKYREKIVKVERKLETFRASRRTGSTEEAEEAGWRDLEGIDEAEIAEDAEVKRLTEEAAKAAAAAGCEPAENPDISSNDVPLLVALDIPIEEVMRSGTSSSTTTTTSPPPKLTSNVPWPRRQQERRRFRTLSSLMEGWLHVLSMFAVGILATIALTVSASGFVAGFAVGACTCILAISTVSLLLRSPEDPEVKPIPSVDGSSLPTPAEEHKPVDEYEGWMHEGRYSSSLYDLDRCRMGVTEPVYLELKGQRLTVHSTRQRVRQRATPGEAKMAPRPIKTRQFNITHCPVILLPLDLTRKRLWSRKYPLCIQMKGNPTNVIQRDSSGEESDEEDVVATKMTVPLGASFSKTSPSSHELNRSPSPSAETPAGAESSSFADYEDEAVQIIEVAKKKKMVADEKSALTRTAREAHRELRAGGLILFARSGREKEFWFRKLTAASKGTTLADAIPSHTIMPAEEAALRGIDHYAEDTREMRKQLAFEAFMRSIIHPGQVSLVLSADHI